MGKTRMGGRGMAMFGGLAACVGFGLAALFDGGLAGAASSLPSGITGGQTLTNGSTLASPDGHYEAVFSGGVLSDRLTGGRTLWNVGSAAAGSEAVLQPNGMLVIFGPSREVLWSSGASGSGCPVLSMQPDGNLVDYDTAAIWSAKSTQHGLQPKDVLASGWSIYSPGFQYRLKMESDGNLVIENNADKEIWSTHTSGDTGAYAVLQTDGNFVVYTAAGRAQWSSATSGHSGDSLALGSNGNLVLTGASGKQLWASGSTGHQGNGAGFDPQVLTASSTPCPAPVPPPTHPVVSTVTNTQTVTAPTVTVVTVAAPAPTPRRRRLDVKMTVDFRFRGDVTLLRSITVGRLPRGTTLTAIYDPREHGRRAAVRRAVDARQLRSLEAELRRFVYRPRQTLTLSLTGRGDSREWATFTFRAGALPSVSPRPRPRR